MNRLHWIRKILGVCCIAFSVSPWLSGANASNWEDESMLLYNASASPLMLSKARDLGNTRMSLYLKAVIAMHHPPSGELSSVEARSLLQQLVDVSDSDHVGIASRFYLARVSHSEDHEADVSVSSAAYYRLFRDKPESFFGQMAFLKHLLYNLYEYEGSLAVAERIAKLEEMGKELSIPDLRRNFHHSMGEAYLHFQLSSMKAFEHWKKAYEIGFANPSAQADLIVRLGELAEKLEKLEFAIILYRDFLKNSPRDERTVEISQRLSSLNSKLRQP